MKTPEEIKKGLGNCITGYEPCIGNCTYEESHGSAPKCMIGLMEDALDYVQQLEAENVKLLEKIKQLEKERDAAIHDLKKTRECTTCEYVKKSPSELPCVSCGIILKNYEWRGPCEENGGGV